MARLLIVMASTHETLASHYYPRAMARLLTVMASSHEALPFPLKGLGGRYREAGLREVGLLYITEVSEVKMEVKTEVKSPR